MTTIANQKIKIESIRPWIESETGMDFSGNRITRLHSAVEKVLSRNPALSADEVWTNPHHVASFLELVTAELTIGESFFFRNEHHMRALREHVFPTVFAHNAHSREIRIWSAGCAGGEEPYSLAILLDRLLSSPAAANSDAKGESPPADTGSTDCVAAADWQISILGTDLNPEFLRRARHGRYRAWSFRQTDVHHDREYFQPDGESFQLTSRVRGWVRFAYLNLVKDVYPSPLTGTLGIDLILFRNVAIYLKPEITRAILARFHDALRPGGWLLLGETEVGLAPTTGFNVRRFDQATLYQKADTDPASGATSCGASFDTPPPIITAVGDVPPAAPPQPAAWPPQPTSWPPPVERRSAAAPGRGAAGPPTGDRREQFEQAVAVGDFAAAERIVDSITARKDRAAARMTLVKELLARADAASARRMLDICLREEPLLIEAQLLRASFAEEAGDWNAAERSYRRALYLDRNCPMAHFHLALVLEQKGDRAGATQSLKTTMKLVDRREPHEVVQYGEGVCYGRLREMIEMVLGESAN